MIDHVANYLKAMTQIHASGQATAETSYYDALAGLLNAVGEQVSPQAKCILTLKNKGAGIPDGGLFTAQQLRGGTATDMSAGANPIGGAMEVKPLSKEVKDIAKTEQVDRYLEKYGQVLVTNYRDFVLVAKDSHGRKHTVDHHQFAASESAFWTASRTHAKTAKKEGPALIRFLQRVMVRTAPISTPEDLARTMAWYAQEALARIETAPLDSLDSFKESLQDALGIEFEDAKSLHFFHSTLVQTLFYGIFSGWVIWSRDASEDDAFDWRTAGWTLHLPALRSLFAEAAKPGKIHLMNVRIVLDWTAEALARVDREAFFDKFESRYAIQYFYEPFLENFDPVLRKDLGVWYTPPEVVHYMVERIDRVLREELDIEDGFADENVIVLDPCVGTGSFLLEVLHRIEKTLQEQGEDEFVASELKKAAMERVLGFEIMPAPFVVAHLQIGLLLQMLGAPLDTPRDERAGIFLTNSLTGWEPPKGPQKVLSFLELQEEKEAADRVKRETPILVVLGNPPYNAYAGTSPKEEKGLVDVYKAGLRNTWGIKKYNLDELYARFMRIAERQIAEHTQKGIICYISSYSYLSDASFVILRERLLQNFDKAWIDSLNGDSRETGKRTPDGLPDPSVFSTERNREGIQLGTSIGLFVKKDEPAGEKEWKYRDFWGAQKREELVASLDAGDFYAEYQLAEPTKENKFTFRPINVSPAYYSWPSVMDLCRSEPSNGLMEKRKGALISMDEEPLRQRMERYFDEKTPWDEIEAEGHGLSTDAARFDAKKARKKVLKISKQERQPERFDSARIVDYAARPFDHQLAYYTGIRPIWNEPRPALWKQFWDGNEFFVTRRHGSKSPEGPPFYWTTRLIDDSLLTLHATAFPVQNAGVEGKITGWIDQAAGSKKITSNYSDSAATYLEELGIHDDGQAATSSLIWLHSLAIGFSPKFLQENRDGIKQDWPHIPLPQDAAALEHSADLGRRVADFLDADSVPGMNKAPLRPELRAIGHVQRVDNGPIDADNDLELTAGWGRPQQGGVFPGKGVKVLRDYTPEELEHLEKGGEALGFDLDKMKAFLGEQTYDIYLNETTYWCNVPESVWDYHIGGYQVIKKWLSYRELPLLERPLKMEEAKEVREMARRIGAIVLMQPELNANYRAIEKAAYNWPPKRKGAEKLPIEVE